MDGENNGKPYFLMDDLGGKPSIFGNTNNNNSKTKELKTWDFAQVFSIQASSDVGLVEFFRRVRWMENTQLFTGAPPMAPPTKINMSP